MEFYQQTTQTKCFMWLEKNKIRVKECTKSMKSDNRVIKSDKFPFKQGEIAIRGSVIQEHHYLYTIVWGKK